LVTQLNIGCGDAPTAGWINYDNSPAVRLARSPVLTWLLRSMGLLDAGNLAFIDNCRRFGIRYANASHRIPHADETVDTIYSSHMIEHLDRQEAADFLAECLRVLKPGGVLRLSAPNLRWSILEYVEKGRADEFVAQLQFDLDRPRGVVGKLRQLLSGGRGHHWMYDGPSLRELVAAGGFADVEVVPAGETRLAASGDLDLREREIESVYVEANRPSLTQS
jgi:predicted SAM-dependent methyltransferase